jgi:hypothetical protein
MSGFIGKRTSLLQRRRDRSVEAFREHWAGAHAAIACTMPGIANYTQNRVSECLWSPADSALAYDADGIVELEFRNEQLLAQANASEAVRALLPEDEPRFLEGITLCRVPVGARQVWPGTTKVMLAACVVGGASRALDALEQAIALTGAIEASIEPVSAAFHRTHLRHEAHAPEVFATLWFPQAVDLKSVFAAGSAWTAAAAHCIEAGALWRSDPLVIVDQQR